MMKRLRADGDMQPNGDFVDYAPCRVGCERTAAWPLTAQKLPNKEGGHHATRDWFFHSGPTWGALSAGNAVAQQQQPPAVEPQSARFRYEPHHRWRADDACRIAGHETPILQEEEIRAVVETRTVPWLGGADT
jgi:hypothetical protein